MNLYDYYTAATHYCRQNGIDPYNTVVTATQNGTRDTPVWELEAARLGYLHESLKALRAGGFEVP